eukprot:c21536_g1_i1.p1 GENE.c21536_g1_i1~~c21536_g1_i1.p1  ORF type:complete len:724 (-),score=311.80 c21536_g1_i1:22-1950(-)
MIPFRIDTLTTSAACMDAPEMDFICDTAMTNGGRYDSWNTARDPGMGMSYWTRDEFEYYYTLYDNFLTGDQYFQSTFTETNPNRLHLFSGSNGLSVGHSAVMNNDEPTPGWGWETLAETLEKAGISWKVYMETDNFDDNGFAWFANFQKAKPGEPLYEKGMKRSTDFVADFKNDVENGNLPQVSWLIAPTALSEHATNHPPAGEDLTARLLKVLQDNPEVYAESVFILNYDEGGQFYDHHWTPTPPASDQYGKSTVTTVGEIIPDVELPIGLGFRVPLLIVSPWTRGNIVISQVFDHTSVARFLEKRFNITCNNISPWRRTVTGDLTTAFDFDHPDYTWPVLPDTSNYTKQANDECDHNPYPTIPSVQTFPKQELGVRKSRALPYEFIISDVIATNGVNLTMNNTGEQGSPFLVIFENDGKTNTPKKYTIESGKSITDLIPNSSSSSGSYSFSLHAPNGFVRKFSGTGKELVSSFLFYNVKNNTIVIRMSNLNSQSRNIFTINDNAYGFGGPWTFNLNPSETNDFEINTSSSGNWYDLSVKVGTFERRFMGRMETGVDTISDPAMGAGIPANPNQEQIENHPNLPDHVTHLKIAKIYLAQLAQKTRPRQGINGEPLIPEDPQSIEANLQKDGRHYLNTKKEL